MYQQANAPGQQGPVGAKGAHLDASQSLKVTDEHQGRFGAAAHLLDQLDTRPLDLRRRPRSWWRFW